MNAGGGSLILTSSVAGLKGQPFLLPYARGEARGGRNHAHPHQRAGAASHPGQLHPPHGGEHDDGHGVWRAHGRRRILSDFTIGSIYMNSLPVELVEPEDITNAVLFLASDEGSVRHRLTMTVDAGATAR